MTTSVNEVGNFLSDSPAADSLIFPTKFLASCYLFIIIRDISLMIIFFFFVLITF